MRKFALVSALAASALATAAPLAHADRGEPPPIYGFYDLSIDFAKQTFNGMPTPMESKTFPTEFTTHCDVNGCVVQMDNSDDHARNPGAPESYEYQWNNGRWETSGEYAYFCDRSDPSSAVTAQRSDYWVPNPDGSFFGQRTLITEGAGCPGEGPGTHMVPISMTPIDPPQAG